MEVLVERAQVKDEVLIPSGSQAVVHYVSLALDRSNSQHYVGVGETSFVKCQEIPASEHVDIYSGKRGLGIHLNFDEKNNIIGKIHSSRRTIGSEKKYQIYKKFRFKRYGRNFQLLS